jgi:uncharacterized flavoprotein (TIGR03862 family)
VAGKGGFNLTHSEDVDEFIKRYTPESFLSDSIQKFTNQDLRNWLDETGIPTFVGSSNRVYPVKGIKPIEVLKAFETKLQNNNVTIKHDHKWLGWDADDSLQFEKNEIVEADYVIFALGGGSWKVTGSDGSWLELFHNKGINAKPFQASNCNFQVDWNPQLLSKIEGQPLKNVTMSIDGKTQKGEAIITKNGMEGNAIYALSPQIRKHLSENNIAIVYVDFKTQLTVSKIANKLRESAANKVTEKLKVALKLTKVQVDLIKSVTSKEQFNNLDYLSQHIKDFPIEITGLSPLDEAISTVGGIALSEVNENFELHKMSRHYCIGEMLDWDTPTGGYLLQGCFSMGVSVARKLNAEN